MPITVTGNVVHSFVILDLIEFGRILDISARQTLDISWYENNQLKLASQLLETFL